MAEKTVYKLALASSGLCNQLYFLFASIMEGIKNKYSIINVDNFLLDINYNNYCSISEIIDVHHLNMILEKYNIRIFDINTNNNLSLINVNYGGLNITSKFSELYLKNNSINIQKKTNLNKIFSDPKPFVKKTLHIQCILNNKLIDIIEQEKNGLLINDVKIGYSELYDNYKYSDWRLLFNNYDNFEFLYYIIKNFKFNKSIIDKSLAFFEKKDINVNNDLNIIHLRIENDSINNWCKLNNLNYDEYKLKLENKFINLIDNYFDKNIPIIILGSDTNNNVVEHLKSNNYTFFLYDAKDLKKREYNAAVDLQIGLSCNNVFIGCESSTFSQLIHKKIQNRLSVFINLENIDDENIIINKIYK